MLEKFVVGLLTSLIVAGIPIAYKYGQQQKEELIQEGRVFYGVFGCRILGFILLALMCSELILGILLGKHLDGTLGLILLLILTALLSTVFVLLYKRYFEEKHQVWRFASLPEDDMLSSIKTSSSGKVAGDETTIFCMQCGAKQLANSRFCHNCGTKMYSGK